MFKVDLNDPEYYRTSKFKHQTMTRSLIQQPSPSSEAAAASASFYYADDTSSTLNQIMHNQTAPEFSFTRAAKAKITSWLTKNMSLRRNQKTSFKVDDKPSFGRKLPLTLITSTTSENKYIDVETLSASVDFSDEEELVPKESANCINNVLILTKSDFYPKSSGHTS